MWQHAFPSHHTHTFISDAFNYGFAWCMTCKRTTSTNGSSFLLQYSSLLVVRPIQCHCRHSLQLPYFPCHSHHGCFPHRLGSPHTGPHSARPLVPQRSIDVHKRPGTTCGLACLSGTSYLFGPGTYKFSQYNSSCIHKQAG